ncbi:type II secretion system F family protein [Frankia sp. CiP3]|uniref:type II secretion system F family protein n=1 Tax=Frankia sp. CiP3 TaxID=2880971 RepID=UPI001EF71806|nr:type II secretion system F family protein [Frankia sp. CiP3]
MGIDRDGLILAVVCGSGVGLGLWLAGAGTAPVWAGLRAVVARRIAGLSGQARALRIGGIVAAGLAVGMVTGWPAAAVLAAFAAAVLPGLLAAGRMDKALTARVEAIAGWAEMIRDTLAGAAGLEQAILATAPIAPLPIRAEVLRLAAALQAGRRLPDALAGFADALDDPTADLVVAALVLAATRQARQLTDLLGRLAAAARDQAALRMRTAASRARTRTSTRVIIATTVVMTGGLVLFSPAFVQPYNTVGGQLVLLAVGALFACAFAWLAHMARLPIPDRILTRFPSRSPT